MTFRLRQPLRTGRRGAEFCLPFPHVEWSTRVLKDRLSGRPSCSSPGNHDTTWAAGEVFYVETALAPRRMVSPCLGCDARM